MWNMNYVNGNKINLSNIVWKCTELVTLWPAGGEFSSALWLQKWFYDPILYSNALAVILLQICTQNLPKNNSEGLILKHK